MLSLQTKKWFFIIIAMVSGLVTPFTTNMASFLTLRSAIDHFHSIYVHCTLYCRVPYTRSRLGLRWICLQISVFSSVSGRNINKVRPELHCVCFQTEAAVHLICKQISGVLGIVLRKGGPWENLFTVQKRILESTMTSVSVDKHWFTSCLQIL